VLIQIKSIFFHGGIKHLGIGHNIEQEKVE
jgi:hypothetical protein